MAFMDSHPEVDAVAGSWIFMNASGAPLQETARTPPGPLSAWQIVRDVRQPAIGSTLVRRAVFQRLEGFDGTVSPAEDLDFWIRLAAAGG
jgi:hypothetical protein